MRTSWLYNVVCDHVASLACVPRVPFSSDKPMGVYGMHQTVCASFHVCSPPPAFFSHIGVVTIIVHAFIP